MYYKHAILTVFLVILALIQPAVARPSMPLDGRWEFRFTPDETGEQQGWYKAGTEFPLRLQVPGCWDAQGVGDTTLVITGGLRTESDFVKALALGADAIGISNSALQAIGCLAMRACHSNNCPVGIATQKENLRSRLIVASSAQRLENYFKATTQLMKVLARACGHSHLKGFSRDDLTTWDREMTALAGVPFGGVES